MRKSDGRKPNKETTLICIICDREFISQHAGAKTCGAACRARKSRLYKSPIIQMPSEKPIIQKAFREPKAGYIYAIEMRDCGYVKLGLSVDPYQRISLLQTGSPIDLDLIAYVGVEDMYVAEAQVHALYSGVCVRGEWYGITPNQAIEGLSTLGEDVIVLYKCMYEDIGYEDYTIVPM